MLGYRDVNFNENLQFFVLPKEVHAATVRLPCGYRAATVRLPCGYRWNQRKHAICDCDAVCVLSGRERGQQKQTKVATARAEATKAQTHLARIKARVHTHVSKLHMGTGRRTDMRAHNCHPPMRMQLGQGELYT